MEGRLATACMLLQLFPLLVGVNCALASEPATDPNTQKPIEWKAGVIVDPDRGAAYLMPPGGGLAAVDLRSGRDIWRLPAEQVPLSRCGDLLVTQAEADAPHVLRIVGRDLTAPAAAIFGTDVVLAQDVIASIRDGLETSFRARASCSEKKIIVSWGFSRRVMDGMDPGPGGVSHKEGTVELDGVTGKLLRSTNGRPPEATRARVPAAIASQIKVANLVGETLSVGGAVIVVQRGGATEGITLHRWDIASAKRLPPVQLFVGAPTYRYPSADGRHLLASESAVDTSRGTYVWAIHSSSSGAEVAKLWSDRPGARFLVFDGLLIHDVSTQIDGAKVFGRLRAIDLETDTEVWSRPFLDLRHQGGGPPGASSAPD